MNVWIYSVLSVALVSLISFVGIISISLDEKRLKKILTFMVSFAVGALFGDVFIHIFPDIYKNPATNVHISFLVLSGIFLFFILEKFIWWRHCHSGECDTHTKPVIVLNLLGDGLHNFLDGVIIAASFMASIPLGIATTIAVVLHEIPQEIGDFAVLVSGGLTRARALGLNFLCASVAFAGTLLALFLARA